MDESEGKAVTATPEQLALEVKKLRMRNHEDRLFADLHTSSASRVERLAAAYYLEALKSCAEAQAKDAWAPRITRKAQ